MMYYNCMFFFKDKKCIFHPSVKLEMLYAIEMSLCSPQYYEFLGMLSFSSVP